MKYKIKITAIFMILGIILHSPPLISQEGVVQNEKSACRLTAADANEELMTRKPNTLSVVPEQLDFRGSLAWGQNLWTYELFNLDVDTPTSIQVAYTLDFETFCGDFAPGNDSLFWVIQYPENILKTININTGEVSTISELPVPLSDGVWSGLSIEKSSGAFVGIATNGIQSVLYAIDPLSGAVQELFELGLQAVISSSFDAGGALFIFDIASDSTFSVDLAAETVSDLGPAGFDGNYAQGMAYDPAGDDIYLSAYEDLVGPQLRKLNRATGEAEFIANLPGETAAFGFPGVNTIPSGIDFGDAPETAGSFFTFPTTMAHNGAAHIIDPKVYLGNKIDGEPDGQPSGDARGDDTDLFFPSLGDDEDGVDLPQSVFQGTETSFTVKASVDGFLDVWMDFDLDHTWFNPAEHIFSMQQLTAGNNVLSFTVPPSATPGFAFLRFRFRTEATPLSFDGMASNGEVEDYRVEIKQGSSENLDYGDAPEGFGNYNYKTTFSSNGARHIVTDGIYLGSFVDAEPDGQPSGNASGDDNDLYFPSNGDDEDGVVLPDQVTPGSTSTFEVSASVDGFLDAWMDFDRNGDWDGSDEHIFNTYPLIAGANTLTVNIPENAAQGTSYLRFRFRDNNAPLAWYGPAENGEVEDYTLKISGLSTSGMDFGDAPQGFSSGSYPTLLVNNGPRHIIVPGIYLGSQVDAEPNGQPSINAIGDDTDMFYPSGGDDEDGVIFSGPLLAGSTASITVTSSVAGFLNAWIDFNIDGNWNDGEELIFNQKPLVAGVNAISCTVPDDAVAGLSYARFRFQDYPAAPAVGGEVANGEVEDYAILIQQNSSTGWDFGDAPDDFYPTKLANDGARHLSDGITFLGSVLDTEDDGYNSANAKGDDLNNLDDEDGVSFQNQLFINSTATIQVLASVGGYLNAWIDFNRNGSWADSEDQIFIDQALLSGINTLNFNIPGNSQPGQTFLRFRFGSQTGISFAGPANNGEVEDYMATIYPHWIGNTSPVVHFISVPATLPPLKTNDLLGVFFMDNDGTMKCAGAMIYNQGQINQLIAYGDDPSTPDLKEGFVVGETFNWKLFAVETGLTHEMEAVYDPMFPDHDGKFKSFGFSALTGLNYLENPCEMPQNWAYTITGLSHNISIPLSANPEVYGQPIDYGDWIGVFYQDDNGDDACGGAIQWNGTSNVVLNAFGDDPLTSEKDGFEAGESFKWKIYKCTSMETFSALPSYVAGLPCQGTFGSFCLSELTRKIHLRVRKFGCKVLSLK